MTCWVSSLSSFHPGAVDDNIATIDGIVSVADLENVVVAGHKTLAGIDIGDAGILNEKVLAATKDLTHCYTFLLDEPYD